MDQWTLLIRCIWELPQNLLGAAIAVWLQRRGAIVKWRRAPWGGRLVVTSALCTGVSLGLFVFVGHRRGHNLIAHEIGHTVQSMLLGPMYLPLVGFSSVLWFWLHERCGWHSSQSYYVFWTERWADRLGGVRRI